MPEMQGRIADHQARRATGWRVLEVPIALADVLDGEAARPVLIDCLTLWLTNLMLGGYDVQAAATIGTWRAALGRGGRTQPSWSATRSASASSRKPRSAVRSATKPAA